MILTIDTLATRYSKLPSQIISDATTFDLWVCDGALSWENHKHKPQYSTEDLQAVMAKTRSGVRG